MTGRGGQLPGWKPGRPEIFIQLTWNGQSRKHSLSGNPEKNVWSLGRADVKRQDIDLLGTNTSRQHAKVFVTDRGDVYVEDLSSLGTYVVGSNTRLDAKKRVQWKPGMELKFGAPEGDVGVLHVKESPASVQIPRAVKRSLEAAPAGCEPPKEGAASGSAARGPEPESKRRHTSSAGGGSSAAGEEALIGPAMPPGLRPERPERPGQRPEHKGRKVPYGAPANGATNGSTNGSAGSKKCDKCDGPHPTDACPHFRKTREDHKDAWANYGKKHPLQMGNNGGQFVLRRGRMVRQPGDGSCLFHSLCYGLRRLNCHSNAGELRRELARFIERNPRLEISGDTLEEWVRWDSNRTVRAYANSMAVSGWGGGIEMAACSLLKKVNVHVYECRRSGEFQRISCFDCPERTNRTVHVLYQGGMHYDAITC